MSLLIGFGDFGIGDILSDLELAKSQLAAAQAQIASVQAIGGTPVADMNALYALQNAMGAGEQRDVLVLATNQKYLVSKNSVTAYATIDTATP